MMSIYRFFFFIILFLNFSSLTASAEISKTLENSFKKFFHTDAVSFSAKNLTQNEKGTIHFDKGQLIVDDVVCSIEQGRIENIKFQEKSTSLQKADFSVRQVNCQPELKKDQKKNWLSHDDYFDTSLSYERNMETGKIILNSFEFDIEKKVKLAVKFEGLLPQLSSQQSLLSFLSTEINYLEFNLTDLGFVKDIILLEAKEKKIKPTQLVEKIKEDVNSFFLINQKNKNNILWVEKITDFFNDWNNPKKFHFSVAPKKSFLMTELLLTKTPVELIDRLGVSVQYKKLKAAK